MDLDQNVEKSLHMAGRIRSIIMARYGTEPLAQVFTALLLVAAEIAHSQGLSNVEFRRVARDVYNHAHSEFKENTKPLPKRVLIDPTKEP